MGLVEGRDAPREAPRIGEPAVCLTVRQVAERLGVSPDLVYRLIAAGELPHVRIGPRVIRVRGRDLSEYLLARRRVGTNEPLGEEGLAEDDAP